MIDTSAAADESAIAKRGLVTACVILAVIMTPPSGHLANRFGRKRILMISVTGFVTASILHGLAQSLNEIVGFRLLQGFFGAALVLLSQRILLDICTHEERGSVMAMFGVSVTAGPVLGPAIGGWPAENASWRWVFYINVPIGLLTFFGISFFVQETKKQLHTRLNWFASGEIVREATVCASAFYIFLVHTFTAENSFVNPRLSFDRNFAVGMLVISTIGIIYLTSLALLTPYLQTLMGYSVVTAGIVTGPRGLGTMICMVLVGRLIGKVDTRILLLVGLPVTAYAMHGTMLWMPDVSRWRIDGTGFV